MQYASIKFTKVDLAKYPFLKETTEYVRKLDLKIGDLSSQEFAQVLKRAEARLEEAILYVLVTRETRSDEIEILSFPVAVMLAVATKNSFIEKRYALAEAKQAYNEMKLEPKQKILAIAQNFGWRLSLNNDAKIPYEFALGFTDYLRNTAHLREKKWKLVNRLLAGGSVYLTRNETARLLSEEVRRHIETRLEVKELPRFPKEVTDAAEKIKQLSVERVGKEELEGFPKIIVQEAFPPCIKALYQSFSSGHHLSHIGRFTLTSFLVNIGMPSEKAIELFRSFSDYSERMTRYQVEHIAGERGSRTKYTPPKCETLQTHGVCVNQDELCRRVRHPLSYYRKKSRTA
jgi:DNA primase large subunit